MSQISIVAISFAKNNFPPRNVLVDSPGGFHPVAIGVPANTADPLG